MPAGAAVNAAAAEAEAVAEETYRGFLKKATKQTTDQVLKHAGPRRARRKQKEEEKTWPRRSAEDTEQSSWV